MTTQSSILFTSNGVFVVPPKVSLVWVTMVGGGAAGAPWNDGVLNAGKGGGGAGEYCKRFAVKVTPGESIPVVIGAGGVGMSSAPGMIGDGVNYGTNGGGTSFGRYNVSGGWGAAFGGPGQHTGGAAVPGGDGGGTGGRMTQSPPGYPGGQQEASQPGNNIGGYGTGGSYDSRGLPGVNESPRFQGGAGGAGGGGGGGEIRARWNDGADCEGYDGGFGGQSWLSPDFGGVMWSGGGGGASSMFGQGGRGGGFLRLHGASSGFAPEPTAYGAGGGGGSSARSEGNFGYPSYMYGGSGREGAVRVEWMAPA